MTLRIGLLGFGTVASGLPLLLEENDQKIRSTIGDDVEISKVLVRDEAEKERLLAAGYDYNFVTDIAEIVEDPSLAIIVELMGRIEPAKTFISQALQAGKHVVSANKDLIAVHGQELTALAAENHVGFYYEAAVAGGIPILRTLANSLTSDKVTRVLGVLNGTSNFMLTKMVDEGWTYEQALTVAQELGYAESDPTNDVDGIDAAYKAVILSQFAFGMSVRFDDVSHQGIRSIHKDDVRLAQTLGYVIKLVGDICETQSGLSIQVAPTLLPTSHLLAQVNGVMNAVFVESFGIGQSMYYGPGAGQKPTAVSVMADIISLGQAVVENLPMKPFNTYQESVRLANRADVFNSYYISLEIAKEAKYYAELMEVLSKEGVILSQTLQEPLTDRTNRLVLLTQAISLAQLDAILQALETMSAVTVHNYFKRLGDTHEN